MGAKRLFVALFSIVLISIAACGLALCFFSIESAKAFLVPALIGAAIGLVLSFRLARVWLRPLEEIRVAAEKFIDGEASPRLRISGSEEFQAVSRALRTAAIRLNEQLDALRDQKNELDSVLASMSEMVIAVDHSQRIMNLNPSAEELLGSKLSKLKGLSLEEGLRNTEIQRAVTRVIENKEIIEAEITWFGEQERELHLRGRPLVDSYNRPIGALLVLNEVTEIKRLETIRRDFVANVSHELRTPITSIKGFVETLLDGAIHNPNDAKRFLEIIKRQSERMNAIIEDLLSLSMVEQDGAKENIRFQDEDVQKVIRSAVEICESKAAEKQISLQTNCPPNLCVRMNATLIEQALINLIDNAIKYCSAESKITVAASIDSGLLRLSVHDAGPGIEKVHQERLFERFYRIDQGRTRNKGGTGLGLAIVKHIAQVHDGQASVESRPGEGSTFTIAIPN